MGVYYKLAFLAILCAFVANVVSLATPNWIESSDGTLHVGLWDECVSATGSTVCTQLPLGTKCDSTKGTPPCDSIGAMDCKTCTRLNAVRASVVIAAGFGLLAFAFSAGPACSDLCVRKSQSNGIIVMSLFSALWMLIGVAIYADHFEDVGDFGYSLILGGCAAGLYTLGALFGYLAK